LHFIAAHASLRETAGDIAAARTLNPPTRNNSRLLIEFFPMRSLIYDFLLHFQYLWSGNSALSQFDSH